MARRARSAYSRAQPPFGRVVGGELDPRRDAGEQAAERLEVGDRPSVGARRLLDRHPRLQRAGGEVLQDRIGEARHHADPVRAVAAVRRRLAARARLRRRPPAAPRRPFPPPSESRVDSWRGTISQIRGFGSSVVLKLGVQARWLKA